MLQDKWAKHGSLEQPLLLLLAVVTYCTRIIIFFELLELSRALQEMGSDQLLRWHCHCMARHCTVQLNRLQDRSGLHSFMQRLLSAG